ncbi:MAG: T9SS type A sorting domain-containing protein [Bacteroidales bacterium]|nr:T9SS type A sorting domain-containing protein [Bacteroidales bacterium]
MRTTLLLLFLTLSVSLFSQNSLVSGEYWFDGLYSTAETISFPAGETVNLSDQIDVSHLAAGLHSVHIRVMDEEGLWSAVESGYFIIRSEAGTPESADIVSVRYWLDNDYSGFVETVIPDAQAVNFSYQFDAESLSPGLHTIAFLFTDTGGRQSSPITTFFVKPPVSLANEERTVREFKWMVDFNAAATGTIEFSGESEVNLLTSLDMESHANGLHTLTIWFIDNTGFLSAPVTKFFISRNQAIAPDNRITGYRYWFSDGTMQSFEISEHEADYILLEEPDLRLISEGEYVINIQFRDAEGRWSGTAYQSFVKKLYPWATLTADITDVCAGDSVLFTAVTVDADSVTWHFGDGNESTIEEVRHAYDGSGEYTVSLDAADRETGTVTTISLGNSVLVRALPDIDLGADMDIEEDESVQLDAGTGYQTYLWNGTTGAALYSFSGTDAGVGAHSVNVWVEDQYGCAAGDTIIITVSVASDIDDPVQTSLRVWPNPVRDILKAVWEQDIIPFLGATITDMNGRIMINEPRLYSGDGIDMSALSPGRYMLILNSGSKLYTLPIIKVQ